MNLKSDAKDTAPRIILSANTAWFITNFCTGLIKALRQNGYEPLVVAPSDASASRVLQRLGIDQVEVNVDRSGLNPLADVLLLLSYRRILRRTRAAAYFGFTIKPNVYGALAARSLGIAAIPNVSGLGTAFMKRGALQWLVTHLYRTAFRRLPTIFFQNTEDLELFVRRRIVQSEQAKLLPGLGIDLERFSPAELPGGDPIFLLVGRILRDKGVVEFAEAACKLRKLLPAARFQLLGPLDEGNRTAVKRADIDRWVSQGIIEYLGSTDDVRPFIADSTTVVLPSYREGLPGSLLEGAAMGRPLIATNVPGCRDVVNDGVNGYLCEVRNANSLADSMQRLADLPLAERRAMGTAGRRMVERRFSDALAARCYLDALEHLPRRRVPDDIWG